jgi:hypothetical protein
MTDEETQQRTNEALYLRQLDLETEMQGLDTKRFWDRINKARQKGRESTTPYGMQLLRAAEQGARILRCE